MAFNFLTLMWVQFNIAINDYKANMSKEHIQLKKSRLI
jgi:hypothetical protein